MFMTVGWFLSSHLWSLARGEEVVTEPDFGELQDFLLSDQSAVINVALGVGYVSIEYYKCTSSSGNPQIVEFLLPELIIDV